MSDHSGRHTKEMSIIGYSHYWDNLRPTADLARKARKIIAASDVSICGWDGTGVPLVTPTEIQFNGDESLKQDFETFTLDGSNNFCKTGREPYDTVVVAILIAALLADNGIIYTDGTYEDWLPGIALYEKAVVPLSPGEKFRVLTATNQ